ncbi:MAG: hypothetical protein DYG88_01995 [Chloroflexi bacterium CFX4]|nr:hypothetical protein [Chloroflexi bacterium CFX4]
MQRSAVLPCGGAAAAWGGLVGVAVGIGVSVGVWVAVGVWVGVGVSVGVAVAVDVAVSVAGGAASGICVLVGRGVWVSVGASAAAVGCGKSVCAAIATTKKAPAAAMVNRLSAVRMSNGRGMVRSVGCMCRKILTDGQIAAQFKRFSAQIQGWAGALGAARPKQPVKVNRRQAHFTQQRAACIHNAKGSVLIRE